ncbi:MAG: hypothetical protein ACYST6_05730 [Planctomycetota bacterium]|jgi:hypothetical protein
MSGNYTFTDLNPQLGDEGNVLLAKICRRLQLNAGIASETPAANVAVTNTPLPVEFASTQNVNVVNTPSVNANITNAELNVTSDDELEVIQHEHEKVHHGHSFILTEIRSLGINVEYLWMVSTPVAPTQIHLFGTIFSTMEHTFRMYEAPTAPVGGVAWTPVARNRHNSDPNVVTALSGLGSVGTYGTLLYSHRSGAGRTGSEVQAASEWVLAHATNYLFRVNTHAAGDVTLNLGWYTLS